MNSQLTLRNALHFVGGILLVLVGHALFLGLVVLGTFLWGEFLPHPKQEYWQIGVLIIALAGLGVFQALYIVPLALFFKRRGPQLTLQAILLIAALTLLADGICGGFMHTSY